MPEENKRSFPTLFFWEKLVTLCQNAARSENNRTWHIINFVQNFKTEAWYLRSLSSFSHVCLCSSTAEAWVWEANSTDQAPWMQQLPNKGTLVCWSLLPLLLVHTEAENNQEHNGSYQPPEQSHSLWVFIGSKTHLAHLEEFQPGRKKSSSSKSTLKEFSV